jgi:hypothetical protein
MGISRPNTRLELPLKALLDLGIDGLSCANKTFSSFTRGSL